MPVQPNGMFPEELVSLILSYTSIRDVVRWRTVSKWFQTITHDPDIWKALYTNTPFLRPRKPFLANTSFEDALVQSARLAHSWTTRPLRTVSRFQVPLDGYTASEYFYKPLTIIGGKWLFACQESRRLVLYDINASDSEKTSSPQVIWEQEEEISDWDYSIGTLEDGKWFVYVSLYTEDPQRWKFLGVYMDAESGAPSDIIDLKIPVNPECHSIRLNLGESLCARSPFLSTEDHSLVFDTRTRVFYKFPEFHIAKRSIRSQVNSRDARPFIVPTNTHIIVIRDYRLIFDRIILVQAFTVPDDRCAIEKKDNVLRLSHEGMYDQSFSSRFPDAVIRNSIVDPVTGSTSVKLLERSLKYDGFNGTCTELTLHKPSTGDVAPITIKTSDLVMRGHMPRYPINKVQYIFHDICDEGYARGFFMQEPSRAGNGPIRVTKFELDATRDGCVAVLGRSSRVDLDPDSMAHQSFDGVRGRFCFTGFEDEDEDEDEDDPGLTVPGLTVMDFE